MKLLNNLEIAVKNIINGLYSHPTRLICALTCLSISFFGINNAGATTFSYLVIPSNASDFAKGFSMVKTFSYSSGYDFHYLFANSMGSKSSQISCEFLKEIVGMDNLWGNTLNNNNYPCRIIFSQCGSGSKQGPASMTIKLYNSNIEGHDGKWKIKRIEFGAINMRAEGTTANRSPEIPCAITINGQTIALSDATDVQNLTCEFPEDQQWMNSIVFSTETDAAVQLTKFTIYVDDVSGFDSIDENASRMNQAIDGKYNLPYPKISNFGQSFHGSYSMKLFDYQGNPADCTMTPNSDMSGFELSPIVANGGETSMLDAGQYYACYIVNPMQISANYYAEDGLPFEILPTADGMTINWAYLVKTGKNIYQCAPHPEINWTTDDNTEVSRNWDNAYIDGHRRGTNVYWKQLSENEQNSFRIQAKSNVPQDFSLGRNNLIIRRSSATVPEGYTRLTSAGVNLNGGSGNDSGAIGLVLERNGAVSDPIMVEYTKGEDIPTGINAPVIDEIVSTTWYTVDGSLTQPALHSVGTLLIKVTTLSSGRSVIEKIIVR